MPINTVIAGDALARGLKNTFDNTWQRRYSGVADRLSRCMDLGIQSTLISELYGYYESAPYPQRREFGDEVVSKAFRARNYAVENFSIDISVQWKQEDRIFDQLKGLERQARQAGENFATYPERVFYQYITAATDPKLLGTIPNSPDGVALYSTTDGDAAARFGFTGGNIVTGTGVGSAQVVRNDFFNSLERFLQFQDPESQPALDEDVIRGGISIHFGVANMEIFTAAFAQERTLGFLAGASTTNPRVASAVTNVVLEGGYNVRLIPTQRITDNDWFIFLDGFEPKPLLQQIAKPLTESVQVEENSDIARSRKIEGVFWNTIQGYGSNLPLGTIKVNN